MRRRILQSILAVVILTALLLGLPLMYTAWLWVEDFTRDDLQRRLDRMASEILSQEGDSGMVVGALDTRSLRLAIPQAGRLVVVYPTPGDAASQVDIGEAFVPAPLVESLSLGASGSLRLEVPSEDMRTLQQQAVGAVGLVVLGSILAGTAVAVLTAKRLADPLRDLPRGISVPIPGATESPNSTGYRKFSIRRRWKLPVDCSTSTRWLRTSPINCVAG